MDYKEALKKVQVKKEKEPFMVFKMAYDLNLIVPHKDGVDLMNALSNAEQLHIPYNAQHHIGEVKRDQISITTMSREEYERYKIAGLLSITPDEVLSLSKSTG